MSDEQEDTSFAFVAGGMELGNVWAAFDDLDLTPPEKRGRFHDAVVTLKNALDAYEPLASVFDLNDGRLIAASTVVHRALRDVQVEHLRVTGGPFPRSRDELSPSRSEHRFDVEPPSETDGFEHIPPLEFASVVPLDVPLVSTSGSSRVRDARCYSSGVVLTIEGFLLRGEMGWPAWRTASRAFMRSDRDHVGLVVGGRPADIRGGSASGGTTLAQREESFWVDAPLLGETLECEYRVTEQERVPFTLDAAVLRLARLHSRPI